MFSEKLVKLKESHESVPTAWELIFSKLVPPELQISTSGPAYNLPLMTSGAA